MNDPIRVSGIVPYYEANEMYGTYGVDWVHETVHSQITVREDPKTKLYLVHGPTGPQKKEIGCPVYTHDGVFRAEAVCQFLERITCQ